MKKKLNISEILFSQGGMENCKPGTTIDQKVCHPTLFDYYQFGHAAIKVFTLVIFFNNDFSNLR